MNGTIPEASYYRHVATEWLAMSDRFTDWPNLERFALLRAADNLAQAQQLEKENHQHARTDSNGVPYAI